MHVSSANKRGLVRILFSKSFVYRVVQKKRPILFSLPNVWFRIFCCIFQVVKTVGLGNCLDSKREVSGRYTVQQRIKIVGAYFVTKPVVLTQRKCRKELGRDKVPDRKTIKRLVAKFRETGNVANANKGRSGRSCSVKTPNNVQNLRDRLEESPRKSTRRLSQKVGISRSPVICEFSVMTSSSFLTKFKFCRDKLMTTKQNVLLFVKISAKRLKRTLVC